MRRAAILAVLLASALSTGIGGAAPFAVPVLPRKPVRVMSLSECTDQLVLALLPPERIASVTWLSRDPETSLMARQAAKVGINHGLAEEVVRQQPDLIVADSFAMPATRGLLKRLQYPMIEVAGAENFVQIRAATRQVATAVGEQARGEVLIADMDRKLAALARDPGPPVRVAAWNGGGFGAPKGSLYDAVLAAAGAVNITGGAGYGPPDTEALLAAAPAVLVQGAPTYRQPSLRDNVARHPIVRAFWGDDRTVTIRQAYYFCGTPFAANAALLLRAQLRRASGRAGVPLPFADGASR